MNALQNCKNKSENPQSKTDAIDGIIFLIEDGIKAWELAGQTLTAIRAKEPQAYRIIMERRPWMTPQMLHTLERIGKKEVYPYVLLEPSHHAQWLLGYSYAEQERACTKGVEVLLYYKG